MKAISFLCALLWISPAFAAEEPKDPKDEADKLGEKHEGGKFTLFGHECKAEEDELETTPGSPPLDVDDPGTPGCNGWEINIVTSGEFGKGMDWEAPLFDINYGVGDNLQLKAEIPYEYSRVDGESHSAVGRGELGIKYRFYEDESRDLAIAVYPQLEFAIPGTEAADEGGTLTKVPVLFATKVAETSKGNVMLTANVAYNISSVPMTENYIAGAIGIGFPVTGKLAAMIEGSTEQALGNNMEDVREGYFKANLGLFGPITDHLLWFGSIGQTFASSDAADSSHTCVSFGLRVLAGGP
jgi:hypothetical protein